ncbi:MAG: GAF domain-containing sensor histidine kinase [Elusimicrobiota bacterium]
MKAPPHPKSHASLRKQLREMSSVVRIAVDLSAVVRIDHILRRVYKSFHRFLPYDRIGVALIVDKGRMVRAIGAHSGASARFIRSGYRAPLQGSSLAKILKTGKPRIINDLKAYLRAHPQSDSTRRIVAEGMRSNLTYPLIVQGRAVGFVFFASKRRAIYREDHIASFRWVASLLSRAVERARLYSDLKESDEMKNRLMGIAAHDLRSPLTVVIAYLALMKEETTSPLFTEQIDIVLRNCRQMLSITEDILDVSVIRARGIELSLGRLDLRKFLEDMLSDNQILAQAKSIDIKLEAPSELPSLTVDRSRLTQAFDNLINNAIKYSRPKTTITLRARVVADDVEISVSDQGQGIPQNELALLFQEFGRTSAKPTAGERSIGLGLAIALSIVRAHRGAIRVTNRPEGGATFTVCLPLQARKCGRILIGANP